MDKQNIQFELLTTANISGVRSIHREDVGEDFVDGADTIMELTQYGIDHNCLGHTYAIKYKGVYIGVILLGEAIPWETDPDEMKETPFYRLMGFVIDNRYRGQGIGTYVWKVLSICAIMNLVYALLRLAVTKIITGPRNSIYVMALRKPM